MAQKERNRNTKSEVKTTISENSKKLNEDDLNLNSQEKIIHDNEDKSDLINIAVDHKVNDNKVPEKVPELDANSATLETVNTNSDINKSNINNNS